ncbi:hypothetical protein ULF88_25075 [Halopseudomonas pachastrellae]|nr:hypothetical protein [Halopseudomonas pachastrellae]
MHYPPISWQAQTTHLSQLLEQQRQHPQHSFEARWEIAFGSAETSLQPSSRRCWNSLPPTGTPLSAACRRAPAGVC